MAEPGKSITTYLRGENAKRFDDAVKASGKTAYALAAELIVKGLPPKTETVSSGESPRRGRRGRRVA